MRKASQILLLIGAIISIVVTVIFLVLAGFFMISGTSAEAKQIIAEGIRNGSITVNVPGAVTEAEKVEAVQATYVVLGVMFIFFALFGIVNTVLAFISRSKKSTGLFVCNIVFGFLSGTEVTLLGGIFGLVANSNEKNSQVVTE